MTPAASVVYGYDPVGRLVLTVSDTAPIDAQSYSYTAGTNRLASFTDGSGTRTISYDARGNTLTESRPGGVTVNAGYDGYGRLTSYERSNTGAQAYSYNGLDDRVKVVKPTGTRTFVYEADGRVMGEYGTDATDLKAEFIWALPTLAAPWLAAACGLPMTVFCPPLATLPPPRQAAAMRIALYQPEIAGNVGAVLRLGACMGAKVELIEPLGFVWDDKRVRRAAMDYIDHVAITRHAGFAEFRAAMEPGERLVLFTTKAAQSIYDFALRPDDVLLFGQESAGVPPEVAEACTARVRIPMRPEVRSMNLATSAALALGEALRQTGGLPG